MLLYIALASLLGFVYSGTTRNHHSLPKFCHGLDCPEFTTLQSNKNYTLRRYAASKWVATNITTIQFTEEINRELFYRLFYYISGNNTAHTKINMTAPVLRTVTHGQGPACEDTFITHFMVPFGNQDNTPEPSDPKAYLTTLPQLDVYVKVFGGKPTEDDYVAKVTELAMEIGDPSKYRDDYFFFAGYDGPYVLDRHNEVWLVAKS